MADKKKKPAASAAEKKPSAPAKKPAAAAAEKKSSAPAKKPGIFKRLAKYFRDTRGEFKKIVWPTRQQVVRNTLAVLVMVVIFAIVIWGLDLGLGTLRDWALGALEGSGAAAA